MKLSNGKELNTRGLTWREVRSLKEKGFDLYKPPEERMDEFVEAVVKTVFPEVELDNLLVGEVYQIFREIMEKSLVGVEEGNL